LLNFLGCSRCECMSLTTGGTWTQIVGNGWFHAIYLTCTSLILHCTLTFTPTTSIVGIMQSSIALLHHFGLNEVGSLRIIIFRRMAVMLLRLSIRLDRTGTTEFFKNMFCMHCFLCKAEELQFIRTSEWRHMLTWRSWSQFGSWGFSRRRSSSCRLFISIFTSYQARPP